MNAHSGWTKWRNRNANVYNPGPLEVENGATQQVQYNSGVGFENAYKAGWTDGYSEGYEAGKIVGAGRVGDEVSKRLRKLVEEAMRSD